MIGVRALRIRASVLPKSKAKPQTSSSNRKVDRPLHSLYKTTFLSRSTLHYSRATSIRSYSSDSVPVPAKSIEGFGGPTDPHHYTDDVESACRKGIHLKDAGDTDGALEQYTRAIELSNDTSYRAYSLRGDLNQTVGNLEAALHDYTRVLSFLPTHVPTLTSQASVHKRMGDFEKAKGQFDFILTFEGMYPSAWLGKAECHAQLGEHDLAVEAFKKTLEHKDRWIPVASVYEALGDSLTMTNKVEEAIDSYRQSLGLSSGSKTCWGAYGVVLYMARKFPEATDAFTQAMALGASGLAKAELLVKRASCYLHFQNSSKAMTDCLAALAELPDFYKARLIRAQIFHQQDQYVEAIDDYSAFIRESEEKLSSSAKASTEAMSEHWNQVSEIYARRAECHLELWAEEVKKTGRIDPELILQKVMSEETPPSHAQIVTRFEETIAALSIMGSSTEAKILRAAFDDLVSARKLNLSQSEVPQFITVIHEILNYKPASAAKSKHGVTSLSRSL